MLATTDTATVPWESPDGVTSQKLTATLLGFLDTATTSMGRATHYNTREEQQKAELAAHQELLLLDRDLYACLLMLPGVLDRASQVGVKNLLGTRAGPDRKLLSPTQERMVVNRLVQNLPPQRTLKMFDAFRVGAEGLPKANNARTRKIVLETILTSGSLELWAVKYRKKTRRALTHVWGERRTGIIRAIVARDGRTWTSREGAFLRKNVLRYVPKATPKKERDVLQCVAFILGVKEKGSLPLLKAFEAAKLKLADGKRLPPEVLEGIRGTYHKDTAKEEILKLTAKTMTATQKVQVQKRAKAAGVKVEFDPSRADALKLYIYAFENGVTSEIEVALQDKAQKAAASFPFRFQRIGILVDASRSMMGHITQPLRPMAGALATRDMLIHTADSTTVVYAGGALPPSGEHTSLVAPEGATSLAGGFATLLQDAPDAVFVISDGYENAPAGRFAETVEGARKLGINVPIYHLNPVFAAEAKGVRSLGGTGVHTLPINDPVALGTSLIRGYLESDPVTGVRLLLGMALPQLGGS
jgi:hypothetical protein